MAERIDINATREMLIKSWESLPIPPDASDETRAEIERARRAARMAAEIICYASVEAERSTDTINIIVDQLGVAIAHAAFQTFGNVEGGVNEEANNKAVHALIHVFTDAISKVLHELHYANISGDRVGIIEGEDVEIIRHTLPDA